MKRFTALTILLVLSGHSLGYESSEFVQITQVRPLTSGNVHFQVDNPTAMCGTSVFTIKVQDDGYKAVFSTLLSAAVSGKKIKVETWAACAPDNGWGTEVHGIYVNF